MNDIKTYSQTYNSFSHKMLSEFYGKRKDQNVVFSPFSILMMLAIAADTTSGTTREEIIRALFSEKTGFEDSLSAIREIQDVLTQTDALTSANAVCVNNSIADSIRPTYKDQLLRKFRGELFGSSNIVSDVNNWVKKTTRGMIDRIADDSMADMLACLMNATSFEGKWTEHYTRDDIEYKNFKNSDGTVKETAMLNISEQEYVETETFTGFVKPYKDIGFSFMALLPKKKSYVGMKTVLNKLDLSDAFRKRSYEKVYVLLPEFKFSFDQDMTSYCKELGINELFSDQADFSPFSTARLKMDRILHKARIEVDRQGTKAAAVTAGIVCAGCAPDLDYKEVYLNRPFVFAIMHNGSELPVFAGIINML